MKPAQFWKFIDPAGTFVSANPQQYSFLYFPLANDAEMMSSITPDLKGDIKTSQNHFLMAPASRENLAHSNYSRNFWLYLHHNKTAWSTGGFGPQAASDIILQECGLLYHTIIRKNMALGLKATVTNFVPVTNDHIEIMIVTITNISHKPLTITPTSAIPLYCRSAENIRDHRHVTSLLHRIKQKRSGVVVQPTMSFDERRHTLNQTCYYVFGFEGKNQPPRGSFPTQEMFIGEGGKLLQPQCVFDNFSPRNNSAQELSGKEAMGALRFKTITLKPQRSISYVLQLGITANEKSITKTIAQFNTLEKANCALNTNKQFWKKRLNTLAFTTHDFLFDNWFRWVNLQPILRKIYGCSFLPDFDYGRGGKGWRDLWQDCLSLLLQNPQTVKPWLIANCSGIRIDGTNATIVTKKPGVFIADRNKISRVWMDHGLWPFFTLELYINQTGDFDILFKKTTYFRDGQLMRATAIDADWNGTNQLTTKSGKNYAGTLLEHILVEHLVQFFNVGNHNNIKLENADWNDGLDMAAEKGESVAFSAFYAFNLEKIALLLEKLKTRKKITHVTLLKEVSILLDSLSTSIDYDSVSKKRALLEQYLIATRSRVSGQTVTVAIDKLIRDLRRKSQWISQHINRKEWIKLNQSLGFFNGYYDNKGRRVEGKVKNALRMTLTGQVFPILSGIASEQRIQQIWKAAKLYLQDKKLKGFRLNTDFGELQPDLGRAFAFAYGDKENGAVFSHMGAMFAYALYSRGFVKEGFEVLSSLFRMATSTKRSKIYPTLPEYFNREGRGLYSYLTGSASWFVMTYLTQVWGVRGTDGDLTIAPKLTREQFKHSESIQLECNFANKRIKLIYVNPHKKDYADYIIKNIGSSVAFSQINPSEIVIKRSALTAAKNVSLTITLD